MIGHEMCISWRWYGTKICYPDDFSPGAAATIAHTRSNGQNWDSVSLTRHSEQTDERVSQYGR
jgi:hypothetical protein